MMHIDKEIDTSGLNCPLPILKAKKALNDMVSGQVLKVIATDPGASRDFEALPNKQAMSWSCRKRQKPISSLALSAVDQRLKPLRYSRNDAPTWGCCKASSTVASKNPSLLPQS
jgi:TusA-related sulfurtransferase